MEKKIKVALFEDNQALRIGLMHLFELLPEFEWCGAYPNPTNMIENISKNIPDVVIMDIDMPGMNGIEATKLLHQKFPEIKIVMQTVFDDDEKVFDSICAGAIGYVLKNTHPEEIINTIKNAFEGGTPMTPSIALKVLNKFRQQVSKPANIEKTDLSEREKELLICLTRGLSYKMISAECGISIDTVRFHIKNIYEKLHVHSMTEAVSIAFREKLV